MFTLYSSVLFGLVAIYGATLLILKRGLHPPTFGRNEAQPSVSVIIAARNEEKNIRKCLQYVLDQHYPAHKLEFIVVDDRSEDATPEIVAEFAARDKRIKLLKVRDINPKLAPKKRAVDMGIRGAIGEIILMTDADCTPGRYWVTEMIAHFTPEVGMVAGYNPYQIPSSSNAFQQVLALDYFAMAAVAAASADLGFPLSCTGGNLAYRREVYYELDGLNRVGLSVSGDDDLFLERVRDHSAWQIRYVVNQAAFVPTRPPASLAEFAQQRIRYASKGRHYKRNVTVGLVLLYLMNLSLVVGPVASLAQPQLLIPLAVAYLIKYATEFSFLHKAERMFGTNFSKKIFLLTGLLHPSYIVLAGLAGQLANFNWKGQSFRGRLRPQLPASAQDV